MRLAHFLVATTLAINVGVGFAQSNETVTVVGGKSCGNWVKYRADSDTFAKTVVQNWIMGYLSGAAMNKGSDFLSKLDGDSVFLWYDQYCQNNPLNSLAQASEQLIRERHRR